MHLPRQALPLAALLLACGGEDPAAPHVSSDPVVRSVTVLAVPETLLVGDSLQLTARARDASGIHVPGAPLGWRSLDASIATVGTSGVLRVAGEGAARIVAFSGSHEDTVVVEARAPLRFRDLALGARHACGLTFAGEAWCWGTGTNGILGDTVGSSLAPVRAASGHTFVSLDAAASHTCGLDGEGAAWCWGLNGSGQLGNGTRLGSGIPVRVDAAVAFDTVVVGTATSCALTAAGAAWCWGDNPPTAPLGVSDTATRILRPLQVAGGPYVAIATSERHRCALDAAGVAWCWGDNWSGQLGRTSVVQNAHDSSAVPVRVVGPPALRTVDVAEDHSCGLSQEGIAWCWGYDFWGQSGAGPCCESPPSAVAPTQRFAQLSAGTRGTCAVTAAGETWCWGRNDRGQLGYAPSAANRNAPRRADLLPPLRLVALSRIAQGDEYFSCGLALDDSAVCWGTPLFGELGDGRNDDRRRVARVSFPRTPAGANP